MKILSTNVYVGPNVYASFPVIRHVIDLGVLENWPSVKLGNDFIDGLISALPGLKTHGCSYRSSGGFIRRLREGEGTWLGHIWEHVTLEMQGLAGSDVSFGKTRSTDKIGEYNMVFEYKQKDVGLRACLLARDLLISLMPKEVQTQLNLDLAGFNFEEERVAFIRFAQSKQFGPSTQSLVDAAKLRGIPYIRLNNQSLVQFGHGKFQKRIRATITSQTTDIAVVLASDKEATNQLLDALGLPVPQQKLVRTPFEAVAAANRLGYPVVVKPLDANHGRGISINLTDDKQVMEAFEVAVEHARYALVEQYIIGFDHRMLVVNGKLVAVAIRVPGPVIGDGIHTISQLVDIVNEDARRGVGHEKVLTRIELDYQAEALMEFAGYNANSILPKDELLYLRSTANLSTGGTAIDMTDVVHPDNRHMAERAVGAVGLDVGGVDFLTADITKSYLEVGGAIVEVNAAPGFRMHVSPSEGKSRDVAGAVMNMLFPNKHEARIPIATITGTNGKTTTSRMVAHMWKHAGKQVGLTTTDGIYVNGRLTVAGDTTGPKSAQMVLRDPSVDIGIFETARGGLLRNGLGFDYCNVGACLNVSSDHLGLHGVTTIAELSRVKRIVVEAAKDTAVLNADDAECLKMSAYTQAKNIFYVTMNPEHDLVREHIRAGGKAITLESSLNGSMITIFDNLVHMPVLWTHLIPATIEGKAIHNVQNAMFAAAITYSMGMSLDDIKNGLMTFTTSFFQAPGRMNFFEEHPFKVLLDYAHNPAALTLLCDLVGKLDVRGKRICVISAPGDRRNQDVLELATIAAGCFDRFICKQDDGKRGRSDGEIPELLKGGLIAAGVKPENIHVILSEEEAINYGLSHAAENDLLVILADDIKRSWRQITQFNTSNEEQEKTQQTISAKPVKIKSNLSEELSQIIRGGIVSDERGVRIAYTEDDEISD
ncbi:MAG: cphA [Burkholderiales bacterium]|nr:cphA [Burkholderiales bacterium]